MSTLKRVAIIIVVWNNFPDTRECLQSLRILNYKQYKILVIDNGSTDDSGTLVKENFDEVIVLRNIENLGYTGGCNTGLSYACSELDADYCLILNNDTVIRDPDFLNVIVETAEKYNCAGITAPIVYDYADPEIIQNAGVRINLFMGRARPIKIADPKIVRSDAVHGCAFLVKRGVYEAIGGLDDQFYLYWEEIDYCLRVNQAGYQIILTPETRIFHKSGRTIGGRGFSYTYYFFRNRLLLLRKHGCWYHWIVLSLLLPVYIAIHILKSTQEGNNIWQTLSVIKEAWQDYTNRNFGKRKSAQ